MSNVRDLATQFTPDTLFSSLLDNGGTDTETEEEADKSLDLALFTVEKRTQLNTFQKLLGELKVVKASKDKKLAKLRGEVIPDLLANGDAKTPARIIIFTRFKDTLSYLSDELKGKSDYEVFTLYGDLSEAARDERFQAFCQCQRAVLIATDVISEGLNLQDAAAMVIHYDLPWNPNRIEQRVGRVDRFGQKAPIVYVRTFYCQDTADEAVMGLLVRKLEQIRADQGFCPPSFLSEEKQLQLIMKHTRKKTTQDAGQLSIFDVPDTQDSLFDDDYIGRIKSDGFYGQQVVQVNEISQRLREAHAKFGSPEQIREFIRNSFSPFQCSLDEDPKEQGLYHVMIPNPRFRVPGVPSGAKAVLDPSEKGRHPGAIVLDVGHPLVKRAISVIRESALQDTTEGARTACYRVKEHSGSVLIGQALLRAITKTKRPQLLEEVVLFGVKLPGSQELTADEVVDWLGAPMVEDDPVKEAERPAELLKTCYQDPAFARARSNSRQAALTALIEFRRARKEELVDENSDWLQGFDEVEEIGFDLHTLTLILPERN